MHPSVLVNRTSVLAKANEPRTESVETFRKPTVQIFIPVHEDIVRNLLGADLATECVDSQSIDFVVS